MGPSIDKSRYWRNISLFTMQVTSAAWRPPRGQWRTLAAFQRAQSCCMCCIVNVISVSVESTCTRRAPRVGMMRKPRFRPVLDEIDRRALPHTARSIRLHDQLRHHRTPRFGHHPAPGRRKVAAQSSAPPLKLNRDPQRQILSLLVQQTLCSAGGRFWSGSMPWVWRAGLLCTVATSPRRQTRPLAFQPANQFSPAVENPTSSTVP